MPSSAQGLWDLDRASRIALSLDRVADAAFPLAIGLLCLDARYAAYLTLLVWLIWRLFLQLQRHPIVGVFLLILGAQAGQFVLERDLQPSSASDPLVIALGFVAMFGRSHFQWRNTLGWLAASVLPLLAWTFGHGVAGPLHLPVGGINRLGFLLGFLQLVSWASCWLAIRWWSRCMYGFLVIACVPMMVLNGSRVSLLAPLVAVITCLICALAFRPQWLAFSPVWRPIVVWRRHIAVALAATGLVLAVSISHAWYQYSPSPSSSGVSHVNENTLSDQGRFETASCWARQPLHRGEQKLLFGLGYNTMVQRHCTAKKVPSMRAMGRPEGLPHAHNLFAQIFAENGLMGLFSLLSLLVILIRQAWMSEGLSHAEVMQRFFFSVPLLIYLLMNGAISSFQIFLMSNQLLIGVGLASLWCGREDASRQSSNPRVLSNPIRPK